MQNFTIAFRIVGLFNERSEMASGDLVAEHIEVNKYEWPDLGLSKETTQSIKSVSNGSFIIGISFKGAGEIT